MLPTFLYLIPSSQWFEGVLKCDDLPAPEASVLDGEAHRWHGAHVVHASSQPHCLALPPHCVQPFDQLRGLDDAILRAGGRIGVDNDNAVINDVAHPVIPPRSSQYLRSAS